MSIVFPFIFASSSIDIQSSDMVQPLLPCLPDVSIDLKLLSDVYDSIENVDDEQMILMIVLVNHFLNLMVVLVLMKMNVLLYYQVRLVLVVR